MKKNIIFLFAAFALASCDYYEGRNLAEVSPHDSIQNGHILALADETEYIRHQIDSLKRQNLELARIVIRQDSIIQSKLDKASRRENTGRFIGGLLKGLIPGL
jgi:hypothetical protein